MTKYQIYVQLYVPAMYDHSAGGHVEFIPILSVRALNEESALLAAKLKTDHRPLAVERFEVPNNW
jgi:hypothetical protein